MQIGRVLVIAGKKTMNVLEDYGLFKLVESTGASYTKLVFGDSPCGAECCDEDEEVEKLSSKAMKKLKL